jgi:hypothetical protein
MLMMPVMLENPPGNKSPLRMTKKSRARGESFHGERNGWVLMGYGTAAASIDDCALVSEVVGKW